jgi:hypothetical protein
MTNKLGCTLGAFGISIHGMAPHLHKTTLANTVTFIFFQDTTAEHVIQQHTLYISAYCLFILCPLELWRTFASGASCFVHFC